MTINTFLFYYGMTIFAIQITRFGMMEQEVQYMATCAITTRNDILHHKNSNETGWIYTDKLM